MERDGDKRAIWVPMFRTVDGHTCGSDGRSMTSRFKIFRTEIVLRVLLIVLGSVVLQFVVARWITRRAERIGRDLTEGVKHTLESIPVRFNWTAHPSCASWPTPDACRARMPARPQPARTCPRAEATNR